MDIRERKKAFRAEVKAAEAQLTEGYLKSSSLSLCRQIIALEDYRKAEVIFAFISFGREWDTAALLDDAWAAGKTVVVPRCRSGGQMDLCVICGRDDLEPGAYGILEPKADCPIVTEADIDLAVIPCLCCSEKGERMGRGGGYYDRFLERYKGPAVLPCRRALLRDDVPMEPHDAVVPRVITD